MEIYEAIAYLKLHGKTIGSEAQAGDPAARNVIEAYQFVYKCPGDPMAQVLLGERIKEYQQARAARVTGA